MGNAPIRNLGSSDQRPSPPTAKSVDSQSYKDLVNTAGGDRKLTDKEILQLKQEYRSLPPPTREEVVAWLTQKDLALEVDPLDSQTVTYGPHARILFSLFEEVRTEEAAGIASTAAITGLSESKERALIADKIIKTHQLSADTSAKATALARQALDLLPIEILRVFERSDVNLVFVPGSVLGSALGTYFSRPNSALVAFNGKGDRPDERVKADVIHELMHAYDTITGETAWGKDYATLYRLDTAQLAGYEQSRANEAFADIAAQIYVPGYHGAFGDAEAHPSQRTPHLYKYFNELLQEMHGITAAPSAASTGGDWRNKLIDVPYSANELEPVAHALADFSRFDAQYLPRQIEAVAALANQQNLTLDIATRLYLRVRKAESAPMISRSVKAVGELSRISSETGVPVDRIVGLYEKLRAYSYFDTDYLDQEFAGIMDASGRGKVSPERATEIFIKIRRNEGESMISASLGVLKQLTDEAQRRGVTLDKAYHDSRPWWETWFSGLNAP